MALHFRPKRLLLLGFVIGSKFIPQPAFCKTACWWQYGQINKLLKWKI